MAELLGRATDGFVAACHVASSEHFVDHFRRGGDDGDKGGEETALHNHAGIQIEGTLETVPIEGFDRSWEVNVRAHFIAARLVVPT